MSERTLRNHQDNVIYKRMKGGENMLSKLTGRHLDYFATDGLRTLCIAEREIEESVFKVSMLCHFERSKYVVG